MNMDAQVLFVDDDPNVRALAERVIRMAEMTPELHESGESALDWIAQGNQPAVVVLDWSLPGIHGDAVLDALAQALPETPVIISSGYGDAEQADPADFPMPIYFLSKPYKPQEMIDLLKGVIS
jgi:DNA-binding NtrC family response regulator